MSLPNQSTWNFFKGTWFYYHHGDHTVHIFLKNNGKQLIYYNGELAAEMRTLKLKSQQKVTVANLEIETRTYPNNLTLTKFTTELVLNGELKKIFTMEYKKNWKVYLPMIIVVVLCTIPMVLLQFPNWAMIVVTLLIPFLKVLFFSKNMFEIEERDNVMNLNV